MTQPGVGILGTGAFLPNDVRTNAWWPTATVARWIEHRDAIFPSRENVDIGKLSDGERRVVEAFEKYRDDPFQGARERRVLADETLSSEMEAEAARRALDHAGIAIRDVDVLLTYAQVPDYLCVNHACIVHHRLGLRSDCFTLNVDAVCSSFLLQMHLAQQMIRSGTARYALLVQSSLTTRIIDPERAISPWFGDGATASVVGAVAPGRGILGSVFFSDGSLHKGFVATVRDGRWYDDGRVLGHSEDREASHRMMLSTPDLAKRLVHASLDRANTPPEEVAFFACHQPLSWSRAVNQEYVGLGHAAHGDVFAQVASVGPSNVPMQLHRGLEKGDLRDDEIVSLVAYASGLSAGGMVLRWGR